MRELGACSAALLIALLWPAPVAVEADAAALCSSLVSVALANGTVTSAEEVGPGAFAPPPTTAGGGPVVQPYTALPAFCRVTATLTPTSDSQIKIEVWLPSTAWNGKFQGVGNGGWAGTISYAALANAVARGYAAASTDTGHSTRGASFVLGHPEKLVDFAHRAVHEMTVHAKAITTTFYDRAPSLAIWDGCSTGGRQGLAEASRYPADYDAIIAGAPPAAWARLAGVRIAVNQFVSRSASSYIPPTKYGLINDAVVKACDAEDGVSDGVLEDPTACRFNPTTLQCKGGDSASCLTPPQVETAKALYASVKDPATGAILYPSLLQPGSELQWAIIAGPEPYQNSVEVLRYLAYKDPAWDWRSFNPATDVALMDAAGEVLNSSPNLGPFFARGGKLLLYHGWSDPTNPAMTSVTYFDRIVETVGRDVVGKSVRLYMVPGMAHCRGGVGTDTFDRVAAVENWVATGTAPASIVAARLTAGKVTRTRPLCPYPQVARYSGTGSTDEASSFACLSPER